MSKDDHPDLWDLDEIYRRDPSLLGFDEKKHTEMPKRYSSSRKPSGSVDGPSVAFAFYVIIFGIAALWSGKVIAVLIYLAVLFIWLYFLNKRG
ncbi:MAG: hypothetical protein K5637_07725 [Lachnospiraceae bacterium]|nr:hypothetical protein [Lachnospiraceae bacterium]